MNDFKINYDDINVEKIMAQIQARIKEKREKGVYDKLLEELLIQKYSNNLNTDIYSDLYTLRELSKITFDYAYTSHRPFIGSFIILVKKIFCFLYKIALKPIYQRQEAFNSLVFSILHKIVDKIEQLEKK